MNQQEYHDTTLPPIHIPEEWEQEVVKLLDTLQVYGDPGFYHGCGFMFDRPTGGFDEDFSFDDEYQRNMPGKLARETLENFSKRIPDIEARAESSSKEQQKNEVRSSSVPARSIIWVARTWLGNLFWRMGTSLIRMGSRVGTWDSDRFSSNLQSQDS